MFSRKKREINDAFSEDAKVLIDKARIVALELGSDRISSIHFFLADCELNKTCSIRDFGFRNTEAYQIYFESQRFINNTIFVGESVPLTIEAEQVIKKSFIEKRCYLSKTIEPYHIFLAAIKYKKSLFYSHNLRKENIDNKLENYYIKKGCIKKENVKKNIWYKLAKNGFLVPNI